MPLALRALAARRRNRVGTRSTVVATAAAAVAAATVLAGCGTPTPTAAVDSPSPKWSFVTRPDLTPPVMRATSGALPAETSEGNLVALGIKDLDQKPAMEGPLLVDPTGSPVWVDPTSQAPFDVRVQSYRGKPVLTYWHGTSADSGTGTGSVTVLDTSYHKIAEVTTGGDVGKGHADIHDSTMTSDGRMLLVSFVKARADLSTLGGPKDGWVYEGVVQEVDVATGKVTFEWRSLDHVPVTDTYSNLKKGTGTKDKPFDYFHINDAGLDGKGRLLVSSRNTHTAFEIDRATGKVLWHLGGKENDFTMAGGTSFAWQHDVRREPDGTITIFDNESLPHVGPTSRGLRLRLDMKTMTASLVTQYLPPAQRYSDSQGNVQQLADGNVMVGWGQRPYLGEYAADGTLLGELTFTSGSSYRAYRVTWHATPTTPPDAVVRRSSGGSGSGSVYASWNGATDVASWQVVSGADSASAKVVASADRSGFETKIAAQGLGAYVAVRALDASGTVIGTGVAKS